MCLWIRPSAATNNIIYWHFLYFIQQVDNLKKPVVQKDKTALLMRHSRSVCWLLKCSNPWRFQWGGLQLCGVMGWTERSSVLGSETVGWKDLAERWASLEHGHQHLLHQVCSPGLHPHWFDFPACEEEIQHNTVILMCVSPVVLIQSLTIKLSVYT